MKNMKLGLVLALVLVAVGCGKKKETVLTSPARGTVIGQVDLSTSLQNELERNLKVSLKDSCFQLVQLTQKKTQVIEISNTACPKEVGMLSSSVVETLTLESPLDPKTLNKIDSEILVTKGNVIVGAINKAVKLGKGDRLNPQLDYLCTSGFKPTGYKLEAELERICAITPENKRIKEVTISRDGQNMTVSNFKSRLDKRAADNAFDNMAKEVANAKALANATKTEFAEASKKVNEAVTASKTVAEKAKTESATAVTNANDAKSVAEKAKTESATAVTNANDAKSVAEKAKTESATAVTNATDAKSVAEKAKVDAEKAVVSANNSKAEYDKLIDALKASKKEDIKHQISLREGFIKIYKVQLLDETLKSEVVESIKKQIKENEEVIANLKKQLN